MDRGGNCLQPDLCTSNAGLWRLEDRPTRGKSIAKRCAIAPVTLHSSPKEACGYITSHMKTDRRRTGCLCTRWVCWRKGSCCCWLGCDCPLQQSREPLPRIRRAGRCGGAVKKHRAGTSIPAWAASCAVKLLELYPREAFRQQVADCRNQHAAGKSLSFDPIRKSQATGSSLVFSDQGGSENEGNSRLCIASHGQFP